MVDLQKAPLCTSRLTAFGSRWDLVFPAPYPLAWVTLQQSSRVAGAAFHPPVPHSGLLIFRYLRIIKLTHTPTYVLPSARSVMALGGCLNHRVVVYGLILLLEELLWFKPEV